MAAVVLQDCQDQEATQARQEVLQKTEIDMKLIETTPVHGGEIRLYQLTPEEVQYIKDCDSMYRFKESLRKALRRIWKLIRF